MALTEFKSCLNALKSSLKKIEKEGVKDFDVKVGGDFGYYDFKDSRQRFLVRSVNTNMNRIMMLMSLLEQEIGYDRADRITFERLKGIVGELSRSYKNAKVAVGLVEKAEGLVGGIRIKEKKIVFGVEAFEVDSWRKVPSEIRDELKADVSELNKAYRNGCYRSCVILCGRILESVLHRVYYDVTGVDALEKSPGIGLGNLIAKLREKNVQLDPAITQQVHLINQVRVFSVHRKKEVFYPTREQTQAIILFTMDIVNRLHK